MIRNPLPTNGPRRRLFYALWPDNACRDALQSVQQEAGLDGRMVPRDNLHLTLAFLGSQEPSRLAALAGALDLVPREGFSIVLNRPGWFAKPRVAWLGSDNVPQELPRLQSDLAGRLTAMNIEFDAGRIFRPHVTLARDVSGPPAILCAAVLWQAREIALVESMSIPGGVRYAVLSSATLDMQG